MVHGDDDGLLRAAKWPSGGVFARENWKNFAEVQSGKFSLISGGGFAEKRSGDTKVFNTTFFCYVATFFYVHRLQEI